MKLQPSFRIRDVIIFLIIFMNLASHLLMGLLALRCRTGLNLCVSLFVTAQCKPFTCCSARFNSEILKAFSHLFISSCQAVFNQGWVYINLKQSKGTSVLSTRTAVMCVQFHIFILHCIDPLTWKHHFLIRKLLN